MEIKYPILAAFQIILFKKSEIFFNYIKNQPKLDL